MPRKVQHIPILLLAWLLLGAGALAVGAATAPDAEAAALPTAPESGAGALERQIVDLNRILIAKENEIEAARGKLAEAAAAGDKERKAAAIELAARTVQLDEATKALSDLRAACTSLISDVAMSLEGGQLGKRDARAMARDFPDSADQIARIRELLGKYEIRKKDEEIAGLIRQAASLKQQTADDRASALAEHERVMDDADKRVKAFAAETETLRKQLAECNATAPEKDRRIESLSQQVGFMQKEIAELRDLIRQKDKEIRARGKPQGDASGGEDAEIAELRSQLERSAEIQRKLRRELASLRATGSQPAAGTGDELKRMMSLEGSPLAQPGDPRSDQKVSDMIQKAKTEVKDAPRDEIP